MYITKTWDDESDLAAIKMGVEIYGLKPTRVRAQGLPDLVIDNPHIDSIEID